MSDTLYVKMSQCVEITNDYVTVGDVCQLECKNKTIVNRLKPIKLLNDDSNGKKRYLVSIMKIYEIVDKEFQNVDVQSVGETDCIIEFKKANSDIKWLEILKVTAICIILFFGAGFSIMSFNNDVNVPKLFDQIYFLVTGTRSDGFGVLELTYCIGMSLGILLFFNHFGKKRFTADPTPMEVEMRTYEEEIETTLIDEYSRKKEEKDVG